MDRKAASSTLMDTDRMGRNSPLHEVTDGREEEATDSLSLLQQPITPANAHFCDYATGARVLAANHKNDTGRC